MNTRVDTVRALGQASIGTDKPTRDKLRAAAAAAGMPLSQYIRYLADVATKDKQAVLSGTPLPGSTGVVGMLQAIDAKLDAWIAPKGKRSFLSDINAADAWFWSQLGLDPTSEDIAAFKVWLNERKAKRVQGELNLETT